MQYKDPDNDIVNYHPLSPDLCDELALLRKKVGKHADGDHTKSDPHAYSTFLGYRTFLDLVEELAELFPQGKTRMEVLNEAGEMENDEYLEYIKRTLVGSRKAFVHLAPSCAVEFPGLTSWLLTITTTKNPYLQVRLPDYVGTLTPELTSTVEAFRQQMDALRVEATEIYRMSNYKRTNHPSFLLDHYYSILLMAERDSLDISASELAHPEALAELGEGTSLVLSGLQGGINSARAALPRLLADPELQQKYPLILRVLNNKLNPNPLHPGR